MTGSWRDHVLELAALTADPDAIWGCCEGYAGRDHFPKFIHEHTVAPDAYYIAFRDLTLRHNPGASQAARRSRRPHPAASRRHR